MKKFILGIGALMIMAALTACSSESDYTTKAEALLQEKYAEQFQVTQLYGLVPASNMYSMSVCPVDKPEIVFEASVGIADDTLSDQYVSRSVSAKIEKVMTQNLAGLEGEYLVKAGAILKTSQSDDANMSIEQYLETQPEQAYSMRLVYVPGATGAQEIYETLTHTFDGLEQLKGTMLIYLTDDAALDSVRELFTRVANVNGSFEDALAESTCIRAEFSGGKLYLDKDEFVSKAGEVL